ncbi:hypothetical protein SCHPADRAFT_1003014 [Schizopora paradoxa]|uniref:Uncharacterized protein n=1 Tax=Schizopora paradoxa TaxID=27342 RepID=A0A0H2R1H3_9AGAM|nr:hypothetical protein SCHPADRAFT_1003014 [Schizopora paradoxa]
MSNKDSMDVDKPKRIRHRGGETQKGTCGHKCGTPCMKRLSVPGGALSQHEKKADLHKECAIGCDKNYMLPKEFHVTLEQRKAAQAKDRDRLKCIRALFVLRPLFSVPKSVAAMKEELELFPLSYDLEAKQDNTEWIEEARGFVRQCGHDDKKGKVMYLNEWVLALRTCTTWDEAKTSDDLERLDIQTHKQFYDRLFEAAESTTDYQLKDFGDELSEDYDVIITLLDVTEDTSAQTFSYTKDLLLMLEKHVPIWPPMSDQLLRHDKFKMTEMLDNVAEKMNKPRPLTWRIQDVPDDQMHNVVLKRNASGCRRHFIPRPLQQAKTLQKAIDKHETGEMGVQGCWLAQEYMPSLKEMGEVRVYMTEKSAIQGIVSTSFMEETGDEMTMEGM